MRLCCMYNIKMWLVWLGRLMYCRGFGVQSPWAYRFIRYVVNEHYPYYSYSTLARSVADISKETRKLCEMYFRIANYCQPKCVLDFNPPASAYSKYITAGCRKAEVIEIRGCSKEEQDKIQSVDIARISCVGDYRKFYRQIIGKATTGALFIIEGINGSRDARRFWKEITHNEPHVVTFDLYYCGIVVCDEKRYKQNYIVNF